MLIDLDKTQFSDCRKYRYTLRRDFLTGVNKVAFVMLNPSTADAQLDDPTTRRAVEFAQRLDCKKYLAVNLFAFRSPDPKDLKTVDDPIGPQNNAYLLAAADWADEMIVAWGAGGKYGAIAKTEYKARTKAVMELLSNRQLLCLGRTTHGYPQFPLYLAKDTPLEIFKR